MKKRNRYLKFYSCIIITLMLMVRCTSIDVSEIENLNENKITIIGHAGSGFLSLSNFFPPNSFAGVKTALLKGAVGVEVDVQLSKDSVPILYHDKNLSSLTAKEGCIWNLEADSVIGVAYQCGLPYDWSQEEEIISLEQLLIELKSETDFPEVHLDLRVKNHCKPDEVVSIETYARVLVDLIDRLSVPSNKITMITKQESLLDQIRLLDEEVQLAYEEVGKFENGLKILEKKGYKQLIIKEKLITKEQVKEAHEKGVKILLFGGNSSSGVARLIKMNPDIIQVNNVGAAIGFLE